MFGMFDFLQDSGNYGDRVVDRYETPTLIVSTARVSDGQQPFETAVSHYDYNGGSWVIVEAYNFREEAQAGHNKWVKTMTTEPLPDELRDCFNAHIGQVLNDMGDEGVFKRAVHKS